MVSAGLREIRNGINDGLFTANYPGEENWAIAHRILVPAFGPLMIRGMFDGGCLFLIVVKTWAPGMEVKEFGLIFAFRNV